MMLEINTNTENEEYRDFVKVASAKEKSRSLFSLEFITPKKQYFSNAK